MEKEKELSTVLGTIVKSSFLVFFSVILSKVFSYIYKIVIARNFGPEIYGLFSLGLVVVGIFGAVASAGMAEGLLRYVSFYRGKKENSKIRFIIRRSFNILLLTSFFATLILFFSADFISLKFFNNPNFVYYLKFLSLALPFSILAGAILAIIRGYEKITAYSFLVNFLHNFLKVAILSTAILIGFGQNSIIISHVLAYLILAFISYLFILKYVKKEYIFANELDGPTKKTIAREFVSYSWPVIFSSILFNLFLWIDTLVLGSSKGGAESVGIYGAAITLAGLFSFAQDLFIQLFIPLISRNLSIGNKSIIEETSKQVFKWVFVINLAIAIPLVVFPGVIIQLFFGSEYVLAAQALRLIAFGATFSGFLGLLIGLVNISGKTKKMFVYYLIFSSINLFLDIMLVSKYGINGIALGTTITWILFTATLFVEVKKAYGFYPLRRSLYKIVIAGVIAGILLWIAGKIMVPTITFMIVAGIVFVIGYILFIYLLRAIDSRDLDIIRKLKNKLF